MSRSEKTRPAKRRRSLGVEKLERRDLLAGNVAADIRNGSLAIRGDNQGNQILVERSGTDITISALDDTTTINGQAGPVTLSGYRKNMQVNMRGGDDIVQFANAADELFRINGTLILQR